MVKKFSASNGGQVALHGWVLSTKYEDRKRNKKYPGKTKVYILGEDKLRMDAFDPFGLVAIGTLIINGDKMSLNLIHGKDYKGLIDSDRLKDFFKVDINSKDLFSLFTQLGFKDKHWNCAVDKTGLVLKKCSSDLHKISVSWSGLMTQRGTQILLEHTKAKMTFKVKSYKFYSDYDEGLFRL